MPERPEGMEWPPPPEQNEPKVGSESSDLLGRAACLSAVDAEEELPGGMPDGMWEAIRNDRDAMEEALRIAVRLTKQGIRERIEAA